MPQCAVIGARVHSGWAAIVAIAGDPASPEVIDRRSAVIVDAAVTGANQPYHFAENLELPDAAQYLDGCTAACEQVASESIGAIVEAMGARGYNLASCAIVLAAGRPLPGLPEILASHALIHTAEGEFFREILRQACTAHGIAVAGIRERDLEQRARAVFGARAARLRLTIESMRHSLGPPWRQDQKIAALAATIVLADSCGYPYSKAPSASID